MCEPDADLMGQPQGPTAGLGRTDGSCPELTPPTEDNSYGVAAARESPFRANQIPT